MRSRNVHLLVVLVAGLALVSFGTARAATAASVDLSAILTSDCASDGGDLAFLDDQGTTPPASGSTSTAPAEEKKCKTNKNCSKDDWCSKAACKEKEGMCKEKPKTCPADVVAPVCGCNHRNYKSECAAHKAGVNVAYEGKCKKGKAS